MHSLRYRMSKTITQVHSWTSPTASPRTMGVFVSRRPMAVLLPPAENDMQVSCWTTNPCFFSISYAVLVDDPACTAVCHTHPFRGDKRLRACTSHVEVVQVHELFGSLFGLLVRRRDQVDLPLSDCSGCDSADWTGHVLVLRRVAFHLLDFPVFVMFAVSIGVWTRSAPGRVVIISGLVLQEHLFRGLPSDLIFLDAGGSHCSSGSPSGIWPFWSL